MAFDGFTEWVLRDSEWSGCNLSENEKILTDHLLAPFKEQNRRLRARLEKLAPSGLVNQAVFKALDRFDDELSGRLSHQPLEETIRRVFSDFSLMEQRSIREQFAGGKTGPTGTDIVPLYGYLNSLKDCDAGVQWTLFMPNVVKKQQQGFHLSSFEYKRMPALRFIGFKAEETYENIEKRLEKMGRLDSLSEYKCGFDWDLLLMHHSGMGADAGTWQGLWGRFMKAGTPVPEGFLSLDFVPARSGQAGPPYISQFAYAVFAGDPDTMHQREGYDCDAMYDITRNTMLAQGVGIPYPDKYWTAEAYLEGCHRPSTAYLFCAEL